MSMNNDESWIDLFRSVGKELGLDVPRHGRPWPQAPAPSPPTPSPEHDETSPPGTRLIESSETASRESLAELFESLAARAREGELSLHTGAYSVRFDVPEQVEIDLAAVTQERDGATDVEVAIVVSWQTPPATQHEARHSDPTREGR